MTRRKGPPLPLGRGSVEQFRDVRMSSARHAARQAFVRALVKLRSKEVEELRVSLSTTAEAQRSGVVASWCRQHNVPDWAGIHLYVECAPRDGPVLSIPIESVQ